MKILVFIKQVPNTDDVKLDPKTGNLRREGVQSMMNPLDANAIEAALQLKEIHGGIVSAITMGPPQSADVLKKALGMGCDDAYLLCDRAFGGADTLATSYTLACSAKQIGDFDLILMGRLATDGDTAQTGPAVAAHLGLPQITYASSISIDSGWVYCDRVIGSINQKVRAKLPAVVTVSGDINKPRYASPVNIMKAQKKPRYTWTADTMKCDIARIGSAGSPSSTKRVFEPEKKNGNTVFFEKEAAKSLFDRLQAEHLI